MKKEAIEMELKSIECRLKRETEGFKSRKRSYISILILGVVGLLFSMFVASIKEQIGALDVFNISLLVCVLYKIINDYGSIVLDYKFDTSSLEYRKEYLESLLNDDYKI